MPEASSSIVIARPLAEVFAFFTTPAQDLTWRDGVKDIHSHGEPAVGAVVHQVIAGPFGKGIPADIEITEYAVDSAYGFRVVSGPVRPVGRFTFATEGDGTRVDFALRAEITGLKRAMMSKPVQKSMDAEVAALAKAKAILEG
jgi:carbon monoxide dehydrogenase subunit G